MARKVASFLTIALLLGFNVGLAQNEAPGLDPDPENPNTRVGTRGANFLEIGVGGRALAMAGAGAALQPGVMAMYWNPAAMASAEEFGAAFHYAALYADLDIDHFFAGGYLPFMGGVLGVSWVSLSSGDITRTTEAFPAGGDPVFGATFTWNSTYVGGYYARAITDRLQVGAGLKFVSEGIDNATADWVAFDAGVTFRTGLLGLELGATAQNLGGEAEFSGSAIQRIIGGNTQIFAPTGRNLEVETSTRALALPTLFRFTLLVDVLGSPESLVQAPTQVHTVDFAIDLTDAVDTDVQGSLGLEYSFREIGFLRVGKKFFNEDDRTGDVQANISGADESFFRQDSFRDFGHGLAFGGGLRVPVLGRSLAFDYAYVDVGELDNVQVFSFEFGL